MSEDIKKPRLNLILYLFIFALFYGYSASDFSEFLTLSTDPFSLLPPSRQFLHSSPLPFFLAWSLSLNSKIGYYLIYALGLGFLSFSTVFSFKKLFGNEYQAAISLLLFSPILVSLLHWFGKGDAYLLAFFLLLLSVQNPILKIIFSLLMILCHKEMGSILAFGYYLLFLKRVDLSILGVIAGFSLIAWYQSHLPEIPQSRFGYASSIIKDIILNFIRAPAAHVLLTFNWLWLVIYQVRSSLNWQIAAYILLSFCAAIFTVDHTRVFIICALPAVIKIIHIYLDDKENPKKMSLINEVLPLSFLQLQLVQGHHVVDSAMSRFLLKALPGLGIGT